MTEEKVKEFVGVTGTRYRKSPYGVSLTFVMVRMILRISFVFR